MAHLKIWAKIGPEKKAQNRKSGLSLHSFRVAIDK